MQEPPRRPPRPPYRRWAARRRPDPDASDVKERATREAVEILWRALTEAETVLADAAQEMLRASRQSTPPSPTGDLQEAMRSVADYFGRVVDLIGEERRLLSQQVAALGQAVERLEGQLGTLADALAGLQRQPGTASPAPRRAARAAPSERAESRFAAGGEGVQLSIAPITGFQDLMDLQRALNSLPVVEGVSVDGYLDGEARLVLHFREAVTADRIADGVREVTGQEVAVEEARPEALRLRLRLGPAP